MNRLQVEFGKLRKRIKRECLKKHRHEGAVKVSISITATLDYHPTISIHVWDKDTNIVASYYPQYSSPKQVIGYIRHNLAS